MREMQSTPRQSGRMPVNGIDMYYEVHGRADGIPLVLLPGGGSTIETTFSKVLPALASWVDCKEFVPDRRYL